MIAEENQPPGMGHNRPPSPLVTLVDEQRDAQEPFRERRDEIVEHARTKMVTDTITAGEAADLIKIAEAFLKKLDEDRKARTNPFRTLIEKVKAECDDFLRPLETSIDTLRERLERWGAEEEKRVEAQRQEQTEVFGSLASGPVDIDPKPLPKRKPRKVFARGDYGTSVTRADEREFTVTDVRAVPDFILNAPPVHAAIIQVVKGMAKLGTDVPGITTTTTRANRIR